jgi:two-component system response regulator
MMESAIDIMLVEDNPNDIELAVYAFRKNNIESRTLIVRDGVEALDYIFSRGRYAERRPQDIPRIILLDLKLPKLNGLEVLKQIKSDDTMKKIPVIALTTSKEQSDVNSCYALGVNSYLVKPVVFAEFAEAIRLVVEYWLTLNHFPTSG